LQCLVAIVYLAQLFDVEPLIIYVQEGTGTNFFFLNKIKENGEASRDSGRVGHIYFWVFLHTDRWDMQRVDLK
jgi:hypothetical protein